MKAILTKYHGPTNTRGSRITAFDGDASASIPYPHELSGEACHRAAANALCEKMGYDSTLLISGEMDHGYAFVFAPEVTRVANSPAYSPLTAPQDQDVYVCADCGREFTVAEERDKHFMSDDCKLLGRYDKEDVEHQNSSRLIACIGRQFVINLAEAGIDLAKVDRVNKTPAYAGSSCASHDQCDANMYMAPAFEFVMGREINLQSDDDTELWGKAWDFVKQHGFVKLLSELDTFFTKLSVCAPDTLEDSGHDGAYLDDYLGKYQVNNVASVHVCLDSGWQVLQLTDGSFWSCYGDEMAGTYQQNSFASLTDAIEWLRPMYLACVAENHQ